MIINDSLRAYYNGETLGNTELVNLYKHVIKTAENLAHLGERFDLAMMELIRVAEVLKGFIRARGLSIE